MALVGCSDDPEQESRQLVTFETRPCTTQFVEEGDSLNARSADAMHATRAWEPPSGYYLYDDPSDATITNNAVYSLFKEQENLFYKSIDVYFTRDGKAPLNGTFSYKADGKWHLNMDIEEADDYYLYGFIPKEVAKKATITGNSSYSDGAVLNIQGLKTVTHSDVCVIVGAKDGPDEHTAVSLTTGESLATGNFKVHAQSVQIGADNTGSSNFIYLLFDHLYSTMAFNFLIDETYDALRTIKVRKLELIGYADVHETNIKARYNVEVKLKSNTTGSSPIKEIKFTPDPTSGNLAFEPIYEGEGVTLSHTTPTPFLGCFVPGQNTNFKLRTTYDVYDKNQAKDKDGNLVVDSDGNPVYNLIRKGCIADNAIDLKDKFNTYSSLRGQMFKVTLKVIPTYLYVLSEPDLDNPTITIEH